MVKKVRADGRLITFEGTEGVGKSTQIGKIAAYLQSRGVEVITTREPGGTMLGEKIRSLLLSDEMNDLTELLLMFAARAEHLSEVIQPALTSGKWVLCDRFTESSYAYQGYGRAMSLEKIAQLENLVQETLRPDITFWFDLAVSTGMDRVNQRKSMDRIEQETELFFQRVYEGYRQLTEQRSSQMVRIDANQSVDGVTADLVEALQRFL